MNTDDEETGETDENDMSSWSSSSDDEMTDPSNLCVESVRQSTQHPKENERRLLIGYNAMVV